MIVKGTVLTSTRVDEDVVCWHRCGRVVCIASASGIDTNVRPRHRHCHERQETSIEMS